MSPTPIAARFFSFIQPVLFFDVRFINMHINKMKTTRLPVMVGYQNWIDTLEDEDFTFIKRFILASGSLKELASVYSISYPTIRLRLDRLIQKIQVLEKLDKAGEFERRLRAALADQKIDTPTFKSLLAAHRREMEANHATTDGAD